MKRETDLSTLECGLTAHIRRVGDGCKIRKRLLDLGFTEGAEVCAVLGGCRRGIRAYEVCGTTIALRSADAEHVEVSL